MTATSADRLERADPTSPLLHASGLARRFARGREGGGGAAGRLARAAREGMGSAAGKGSAARAAGRAGSAFGTWFSV